MVDNQRVKDRTGLPIESGQGHARMRGLMNQGEVTMIKFRMFRLPTTVGVLAILIEALGAGAKRA